MKNEKASIEIELKMVLPAKASEAAIVNHLYDKGYAIDKQDERENRDVYLDTADWLLLKSDLALRYRVTNEKALYTIKGLGHVEDGIARRMERDFGLAGLVDIPANVTNKGIRVIIDEILFGGKLIEQILIQTHRRLYQVIPPEGGEIELAFDMSSFTLGEIHKSKSIRKIREMEAELISGPAEVLKSLAGVIIRKFNYSPSRKSKLECAIEYLGVDIF